MLLTFIILILELDSSLNPSNHLKPSLMAIESIFLFTYKCDLHINFSIHQEGIIVCVGSLYHSLAKPASIWCLKQLSFHQSLRALLAQ